MLVIPARVKVVVVMVCALALAAGLLTLTLLAKPAQAQAQTNTTQSRDPLDQTFLNNCTGEVIRIQGTLFSVAHTTVDENGVFHSEFTFVFKGQGVSDSGANYVFHEVGNRTFNLTLAPGDNYNETVTQTGKLIRQGSDTPEDDQEFRALIHVTINDQGEVTSQFETIEFLTCT